MAYRYGLRNVYRPSQLVNKAYGWSTAPGYNRADVPTALMQSAPDNISSDQLLQQFAYEWFQSGQISAGMSNPPFVSGAAGRLLPSLQSASGTPARILRGYIRRAAFDAGDAVSKARLYFMYNPETITRDYVSYLDQSALDPFNTIYQSGNLVAPPSILDFSFDLFFDRQEEATQVSHPGVYVDYQFFDLVVRNVVPSDPNQTSNTLPDNGVMMVNPRDITVVFSPQFTVQGRPLNARVTFMKFTHRMTPTRMSISLTLRANYMGPVRDMTQYRAEEFQAEAAIPYGRDANSNIIVTIGDLLAQQTAANNTPGTTNNYTDQSNVAGDANAKVRRAALDWAKAHVTGSTVYDNSTSGSQRWNLPASADCSGLVVAAYKGVGADTKAIFGSGGYPGTGAMRSYWSSSNYKTVQRIAQADLQKPGILQYGDLLVRTGHIQFFDSYDSNGAFNVFEAAGHNSNPQVGTHHNSAAHYAQKDWFGVRPMPLGRDMSYNANNTSTSRNASDAGP
jgi:hypothetical protein